MTRWCLDALTFLVASLATAVMAVLIALVVVLATGPVPLTVLEPTLRKLVADAAPDMQISFEDPALRWNPDVRDLEVAVRNLDIRGPKGRQLLHVARAAIAPDVATSLETGQLAVKRLVLDEPTVAITRTADGGFGLRVLDQQLVQAGPGNGDPWAAAADFLGRVLAPPGTDDPLAGIEILRAQDAQLLLDDQVTKRRIELGGATLEFRRGPGAAGINAQIGIGANGRAGHVDIRIRRRSDPARYRLSVRLDGIVPSLAPLADTQPVLRDLDVVVDGSMGGSLSADGHPTPLSFRLSSRPTSLSLPDELPSPVALGPFEVGGSIDLVKKELSIERAAGSVEGSDVTGKAQLSLGDAGLGGQGQATIGSVDVDELRRLWPKSLAADARDWVLTHIDAGSVGQATADLALKPSGDGKPPTVDLNGSFSASGVTLRYLDGAPVVRNASATARFNKDALTFQITGGTSQGVSVQGGQVSLTDLEAETSQLSVDLRLASTVPAALGLVGSLPKDIIPSLPLTPDRTSGQAAIRLKLGLPLIADVTADQVRYDVGADLGQLTILGLLPGLDLSEGDISLKVADQTLTATGQAHLHTVPLNLKQLKVDFAGKGPPKTTAQISGRLDPVSLAMLGVDPPGFLEGAADVDLTLEMAGSEPSKAHLLADLAPTSIDLPELRIKKQAGQPGHLEADIGFDKTGAMTLPTLSLSLPDVEVRGSMALAGQDHHLTKLDLSRLDLQGSQLSLVASPMEGGGWEASLRGQRLDLSPWMSGKGTGEKGGGAAAATGGGQGLPPLSLKLDLGQLVLPGETLRDLKGSVERSATQWRASTVAATLPGGKPVRATVTPRGDRPPRLEVTTEDAGGLLNAIIPDQAFSPGGELTLKADLLAEQPATRLKGNLNVHAMTVHGAPMLAKLLTLASLTGIVNTLQGKGIYFERARTDFDLVGGTLKLTDGKAHGSAVGLTAAGVVNLDRGTLAINGTVVPAYAVNKLLGDVPIVGRLLRGEGGVGAFAATYDVKGPWGDPSFMVNPLSVLVPGFIRDLFSDTGGGADAGSPSPAAPTKR